RRCVHRQHYVLGDGVNPPRPRLRQPGSSVSTIGDPLTNLPLTPQKGLTATEPALAGRRARAFLRKTDPVLGRIIDAHPDFRPRAWLDELPPLDAFGTLIFQVAGQQLSVRATRTIVSRIEEHFGGRLPSPAELLAADPGE